MKEVFKERKTEEARLLKKLEEKGCAQQQNAMQEEQIIRPKRKNMCVSCYISKQIRVGRSLLIIFFFIFFFIFPDFTKKHDRCVVCTKCITKRVSFLTIQNACPTVKAFIE